MRYMSPIGIIQENQPITLNSIQYPGDFPKSSIPGLEPITETASGANATQVETESIELVDGVWTVIWAIRDKTEQELAAEKKAKVPFSVTPLQGEFALKKVYPEAYAKLIGAIAGMKDDDDMKIAFNRALEWQRNSPTTLAMLALLGIEEAAADDLFITAQAITV